ncbi:universal stress protein [Rhodoferax sp.]|uniref:universal stress protein n=1 Tax=Rhodoferax sp. TaxID=50421 RepID=UPI0025FC98C5|nr:universal stress protein [Rhodoferax sp.]
MAYTTLMVQLEAGRANTAVLQATGELAERFRAHVVGVAVCRPMQMVYGEAYVSGELIEQEKKQMQAEVDAAEAEFRNALQARATGLEWRSMVMFAPMADFVVHEARSVDLLITARGTKDSLDPSRGVHVGDLIMQSGRPIFVVPPVLEDNTLDRVVVGWTDSREARRAVVDAMPLLQKAAHVVVAEMVVDAEFANAHKRLNDVVAWLQRHGVAAQPLVVLSTGDDAKGLDAIAEEQGAGVIVAGAYGHSRLREWALGGVTRKLLQHADRYLLVSH